MPKKSAYTRREPPGVSQTMERAMKQYGGQVKFTKASRFGLKKRPKVATTTLAPKVDKTLSTTVDSALGANEELGSDPTRLWAIKIIFALRKDENDEVTPHKQAGVFLIRPTGVSQSDVESILALPSSLEMEMRLQEIRDQASKIYSKHFFAIDTDPPNGAQRTTPEGLMNFVRKIWSRHPVRTMGYVELYYERVSVVIKREVMIHGGEQRDQLFSEISTVMELMDRGFLFDGATNSLRRKAPWSIHLT